MRIVSPTEAVPKAVVAGMKAAELDSTSAQVHYTLALLNTWGLWDWKDGEKEFKKTIALNPNDAEAHAYYSRFLHILRRPEEAMKEIEIALNLDPRNPLIKSIYGLDLMSIHRYDDAIKAYKEALKGDPTAPVALKNLPIALYLAGREKEALQEYRMGYKSPEILQALNDGYVKADYIGAMSHVADALVEQSKTTWVKPTLIAVHYTQAGNKDKAIDWLEKAFQEHDPNLPYLLNPIYDSLRNDPRFKDLLRKLNLPDNN
jgi:tetratricopeptide (TPR) repeat protein